MMKKTLSLTSNFTPQGDQPQAIAQIVAAFRRGEKHHTLLGVTGSGKTFTCAHVLQSLNRSALIIAPNKTLAAQLYFEFKQLFPHNAVGYFVSYYDYYQPEAYLPASDTYIAKDSAVNEDIDKLRHQATRFLLEADKAIIVASVSCIYGLGSPKTYADQVLHLRLGEGIQRDYFIRHLIKIQYRRNDGMLERGSFRVRGDLVTVTPAHQQNEAWNIYFGPQAVEEMCVIDSLSGEIKGELSALSIYPNSHYLAEDARLRQMITAIRTDLQIQLEQLSTAGKLVERSRLEERTLHDLELLEQLGFCPGIENYSRYLSGKQAGEPPPCLLDYFPEDFITVIDESHITIGQLGGMYRGDQARKQTLVNYGFRLPSALDNRPLNFEEFQARTKQVLYLSATPAAYEYQVSTSSSAQVLRPTGLLDPPIEVRPAAHQVDDLLWQLKATISDGGRALVSTLTKKMAEDLSSYYHDLGIKVRYLHAEVSTFERVELIRKLRLGEISVLIGINLLREGLDIPEVMLVAILDADKEGFLRSRSSLIQLSGRAARNHRARVIFYADSQTRSISEALTETEERRKQQQAFNSEHGLIPRTVVRDIPDDLHLLFGALESEKTGESSTPPTSARERAGHLASLNQHYQKLSREKLAALIGRKEKEMKKQASMLRFEQAADLRDEIRLLEVLRLSKD